MSVSDTPLGRSVTYPSQYDPSLLFPIARSENRASLNLDGPLPFKGVDIWNAYELSWLDAKGKPRVAMARFTIAADSPNIIESKSFKLYLNSFNQTRLENANALRERLGDDLAHAAGSAVEVDLILPQRFGQLSLSELDGTYLDKLDIEIDTYTPAPELLRCTEAGDKIIEETLVSRLLKSNCPVTGQPDWACVQIRYRGRPIDHAAWLRYIVSFREHAEFHEHCVERIFTDVTQACKPEQLSVYARYTRRGGLDINPWRSNMETTPPADIRTVRQ